MLVGGVPLAELNLAAWHRQIAWVPQHPYLFAGSVADNVRLARPDAGAAAVARALADAGAPDLDPALELGESGTGLSAGQRRRVALARAFLADRPLGAAGRADGARWTGRPKPPYWPPYDG